MEKSITGVLNQLLYVNKLNIHLKVIDDSLKMKGTGDLLKCPTCIVKGKLLQNCDRYLLVQLINSPLYARINLRHLE